ncbi:2-amino-4-hydroxy-6-hydroxymethyldihydropteridine diphosphokinase [Trichlorobacter ammonificans]|uniref:2-amino-4-hydroxy-6-hydroxymethyldihydropteridine pyrophosphokinase n=1 Tax=Trichlorobacter ammonificans TaxID=2916410 RepID=A0ABM9DBR3_9BACT|nr:2-amino-4-hydroxy-6-hydroxymethyldihydropteridine diphosphokinase [Trichlorobacter ammonificans]CAH2032663.1 2-amino-4-hydroxy-6-hydroxymethyldihydropteridinepyrophosphokinase [Trichlorobacter ammonificans]
MPICKLLGQHVPPVDAVRQLCFNPDVETEAYIALGSNLGDRELNLLRAVAELGRLPGCRVTALSGFYETAPVGMPDGTPSFYNAVLRLSTTVASPLDLLHELQRIERDLFGRSRSTTPQSRRMDLDLLLFGEQTRATEELTLPHPRMTQRKFVLMPLLEITPDLIDPRSGRPLRELLPTLPPDQQVRALE